MKIQLKHSSIDFSNYDALILHETFSVISLRVKSEIDERCLQLPLIFRDGRDTREAYKRLLQARNSGSKSVSLSDLNALIQWRRLRRSISMPSTCMTLTDR